MMDLESDNTREILQARVSIRVQIGLCREHKSCDMKTRCSNVRSNTAPMFVDEIW